MPPPSGPLLNARAARILLIAGLVGLVAGSAGYVAYGSSAIAVLVGGAAAGGAMDLFDRLLYRR
jgi:hypothetical protein